jgi:hypothetical protein
MIGILASIRWIAMVVVSLLLSAQLVPSAALACEGGGEEEEKGNNISVNATLVKFTGVTEGSAEVTSTNNNKITNWEPKGNNVKEVKKTKKVWTINDKCSGKKIAPKGGTCKVGITFKANGEAGRFISELEMEGVPATAFVKMEGEE